MSALVRAQKRIKDGKKEAVKVLKQLHNFLASKATQRRLSEVPIPISQTVVVECIYTVFVEKSNRSSQLETIAIIRKRWLHSNGFALNVL